MKTLPIVILGKRAKTSNAGFSLVELLAVVAIMAILTFAALPSLVGVNSSRNLVSAGNLVVSLANEARQNSVTKNTMTALVMVNSSGNPDWDNKLFIIEELPAGATQWQQTSKWEVLPAGVVVDPKPNGTGSSFLNPLPSLSVDLPTLNYQGTSIVPSQCAYQIFLPSGGLIIPSATSPTPPMLSLVSGVMNGAVVTYHGQATSGPNNYYNVTINQYTGMLKVTRP